jgi:hypothetical protein
MLASTLVCTVIYFGLRGYVHSAFAPLDQSVQPLDLAPGQQVTKATVRAYVKEKPESVVVLTSPSDLQFIVDHLRGLESRTYDHSLPQIDLTVELSNSRSIRLRVSEIEIGPDAPASGWNRHWFPKDSALYNFLVNKAYAKPAR